jgi:spermidine synthase
MHCYRGRVKPWETLATATTPDGSTLELRRHDNDYLIRADGYDLMVSRAHGSESAMMALACPQPPSDARVLVGGLGMGYTLAATLDLLPESASVVVGELIPEVVEWNRGLLGPLADHPLDDPRTEVVEGDIADVIDGSRSRFDAILLDVDNGPDSFTQPGNSRLYTPAGLAAARAALRPGGGLAVWSVGHEPTFERRLRAAGFEPSTHSLNAHGKRGRRHVVFVGRKP